MNKEKHEETGTEQLSMKHQIQLEAAVPTAIALRAGGSFHLQWYSERMKIASLKVLPKKELPVLIGVWRLQTLSHSTLIERLWVVNRYDCCHCLQSVQSVGTEALGEDLKQDHLLDVGESERKTTIQ